jgi:hypothetical protein
MQTAEPERCVAFFRAPSTRTLDLFKLFNGQRAPVALSVSTVQEISRIECGLLNLGHCCGLRFSSAYRINRGSHGQNRMKRHRTIPVMRDSWAASGINDGIINLLLLQRV